MPRRLKSQRPKLTWKRRWGRVSSRLILQLNLILISCLEILLFSSHLNCNFAGETCPIIYTFRASGSSHEFRILSHETATLCYLFLVNFHLNFQTNLGLVAAPTVKEIDELLALYREGVRLAEEEEKILKEEPNDVIKNIEILAALRSASETEPVRPPQVVAKSRQVKRQKIETDGAADSPAPIPSPSVVLPAARVKEIKHVRTGSVPRELKQEPVVKVEEGSEGSKGPAGERAGKFFVGAEVAYKQARQKEDGSQWIQCNITSITEIANKKRYLVEADTPVFSDANN